MESQKFAELENRASFSAEMDTIKRLESRARVHQEIELMKASGEAYELSEEEVRLIHSFRRFKLRMRKQGEVFKWQTRMPEGVQLAADTAEVVHPCEISE